MSNDVRVERKLAAILAADVQGYSRLMNADEVGTLRLLTTYREVADALIDHHRGRIVGTAGDSILAEFASAVDAVQCAVDIQQALNTKNADLPLERRMEFRIGINVGDVIVEGPQIYGDGVNIAARLEGLAKPGGIWLSATVYDQVKNKVALSYEYLGEQAVKNIAEPVRVWQVHVGESGRRSPAFEGGSRRGSTAHHAGAHPSLGLQDSTLSPQAQLAVPDKPSIAVLPFINLSNDPEQEYFSDGITEDLITDLSKLSGLFVIARNSTFVYKGKRAKVQEVSKGLGVQYVLEGSVRKVSNRVRITAQLVDATTGHHLWAERYDRELQDIFALQDEISHKIVFALRVKLTEEEQERFRHSPTDNLEAYDAFLRGGEYYSRATQEANAQARQLFEQAIALDPQYSAAYALLGLTHWLEWMYQWSQNPQTLEQAFDLAQKAVDLDDSLPLAHMLLGRACLAKKQLERALAETERAIALDPNDADGHAHLAALLNFAGRPKEAIGSLEKAMRLNPHYPYWYLYHLGVAYTFTRRIEEATAAFKRVLAHNPNFLPAHTFLAAIYSALGREQEAQAEAAAVLRISPNFSLEVQRQMLPVTDQAGAELFFDLLRKAGLK